MIELVLSSIPEFWPKNDKEALYLGLWCFVGNKKYDFWDASKFKIVPSPISSMADTRIFSRYVDELIDRLLPALTPIMNDYYGVSFSNRFWQVSLMPFLMHFLNTFYFKFKCIEKVYDVLKGEKINVRILKNQHQYKIPACNDFINLIWETHEYNLSLFSQIVKEGDFEFLNIIEAASDISETLKNTCKQPVESIVSKVASSVYNCFHSSDIHWGTVYVFSLKDRIILSRCRKSKIEFKVPTKSILPKYSDVEFKNMKLKFKPLNKFEDIVRKCILKNFTSDIISGIPEQEKNERVKYWIGNDMFAAQDKHFKIARIVENGGRWISTQHGGSYGWFYSYPVGKIDYETSGNFISTGWTHKHLYDCKITPLPSPKFSRLPKHKESNNKIVFVGSMGSSYYNRFHSYMVPDDVLIYLENKKKFFLSLKKDVKEKIFYRRYYTDYGIGEQKFLSEFLKDEQFMVTGSKLKYFLQSSRLVVIDHLMSTVLETYTMDTPTVMYYNSEMYKVMDEIKADFEELAEAKLYFEKPEDAAEHVNNVYHDINSWWLSEKVVKAKERFTKKYALNSKDYLKDWIKFAKSLPE